jgi:hypothetical protein
MKSVEINQVSNGFVVVVSDDDSGEQNRYVFAKEYQVMKFLKSIFKSAE